MNLLGLRDIEKFKAEVLARPRSARDKRPISAKRLKNILGVLSKSLRWAETTGVIEHAPRFLMPKIAPSKFDFLADEEAARLRSGVAAEPQRRAMIDVALDAGPRKAAPDPRPRMQ